MAVQDRIRSLQEKHAHLEAEIGRETCRSAPDTSRLKDLKLQKLQIKDALADLSRHSS